MAEIGADSAEVEMPGNKHQNSKPILIDFYNGAYGPTIRIDLKSDKDLGFIADLFSSLAEQKTLQLKLHELDAVSVTGIKSFILSVIPECSRHNKALFVTGNSPDNFACEWKNRPSDWHWCKDMVAADENSPRPSSWHQYLTNVETYDDATVELAFMESAC
jgi:hypothetical protein